jgi:hypothetical protein
VTESRSIPPLGANLTARHTVVGFSMASDGYNYANSLSPPALTLKTSPTRDSGAPGCGSIERRLAALAPDGRAMVIRAYIKMIRLLYGEAAAIRECAVQDLTTDGLE